MKLSLKTLDGFDINYKISGSLKGKKSKLHERARNVIEARFTSIYYLEEVRIPILKNKKLIFDFFIPSFRLFIEVQGEQHFKYIPYFHDGKIEYRKALVYDQSKIEWCELNNFFLIHFNYNESDEEWTLKLN